MKQGIGKCERNVWNSDKAHLSKYQSEEGYCVNLTDFAVLRYGNIVKPLTHIPNVNCGLVIPELLSVLRMTRPGSLPDTTAAVESIRYQVFIAGDDKELGIDNTDRPLLGLRIVLDLMRCSQRVASIPITSKCRMGTVVLGIPSTGSFIGHHYLHVDRSVGGTMVAHPWEHRRGVVIPLMCRLGTGHHHGRQLG
eukprot:scaffold96696_cov36-Tisochrysis_lutea.AAC.2